MGSTEGLIALISTILGIIIVAIIILGGTLIFVLMKRKNRANVLADDNHLDNSIKEKGTTKLQNIESMEKFLDFDEVVDNMIVRKGRKQYLMVVECKGVNYDLLGEEEKISVENGFVQFLNTLKGPIQLYVQTTTLNLKDIVEKYRQRVAEIGEEIQKLDIQLQKEKQKGNEKIVKRIEFDRRRKMNVLEYGTDISEYVGRMSQNRNVLRQNTYLIIPYYTVEFGGEISNYSKEEVDNIAFSELYTKAQTLIRSIAASGVSGRVMESEELVELLYVAYNRDDSEIFSLDRAVEGDYSRLYSTAKDVLEKKKELLDEQIIDQASTLAAKSIKRADKIRRLRLQHQNDIKQKAMELVEDYKLEMDQDLYDETKRQIKKTDFKLEEEKRRQKKLEQQKIGQKKKI
ncbi:MAG TPA: hypothetical protein PK993_03805 [Clostridia bacterium]|nr:hypothetical protein [Clostridia bacterium]